MSFWSRLFGTVKHDKGSLSDQTESNVDAEWSRAECEFCGQQGIECDQAARYLYPIWKCSCGAIGSGAWLPDLDEVGDQLLDVLGITARVSEPCVPTDHPGITMQRYDVDKVEHSMTEILRNHGCEFRVTLKKNPNERLFWAKRINTSA